MDYFAISISVYDLSELKVFLNDLVPRDVSKFTVETAANAIKAVGLLERLASRLPRKDRTEFEKSVRSKVRRLVKVQVQQHIRRLTPLLRRRK